MKVDDGQNDTYKVLEEFNLNEDGGELVLVTLSKIHGPWAFIYWQVIIFLILCYCIHNTLHVAIKLLADHLYPRSEAGGYNMCIYFIFDWQCTIGPHQMD